MNKVGFSLIFLLLVRISSAQSIEKQVISFAGGQEDLTGLSMNWTLGETFIQSFNNNTCLISQGFQQGNLSIPSGLNDISADIQICAYPNPVKDFLSVQFISQSELSHKWQVEIYDLSGKLLYHTSTEQDLLRIDFSTFSDCPYILRLTSDSNYYKTFPIIKQSGTYEKN